MVLSEFLVWHNVIGRVLRALGHRFNPQLSTVGWQSLESFRTQVQPLAWYSGLRIQCCHSSSVGHSLRLRYDPWLGNFYVPQVWPKKPD